MEPFVPRKDFFRLAAAGLGAAAAGSPAAPRVAVAVAPTPVGDDLGYVLFGVVAEVGRGTAASAGLQGVTFLENAGAELDHYLRLTEGSG